MEDISTWCKARQINQWRPTIIAKAHKLYITKGLSDSTISTTLHEHYSQLI